MKRIKALSALLLLLMLITACSSNYAEDSFNESKSLRGESANAPNSIPAEPYEYGLMREPYDKDDLEREAADNRKIIWNASMDIEVKDAAALYGRLASRAAELGGYEHTNDIQHYEAYSVVKATFKLPPRQVHAFMSYAGEEGKVVNSKLGSEDVTENYYDSAQRLETKRATLEPYYRLLADAKDLDEIIRIQRIIDGITEDIEALEGRLRMWDFLTDMATVSVYIRQDNDPVKIEEAPREINWSALSFNDMGYLIKRGFVGLSSGLLTALQWIAITILVTSPLLIPATIAFLIWRKRRKQRRADTVTEETEIVSEEPDDPEV
ncbi:MAG: DUF4349 domain-containing protein [Oscillospiraceae bacterium]|nr:DUF4349 domain-containing protein [Oscillospiraceae bacterium]